MKRRDFVSMVMASMGASFLWSCRKEIEGPASDAIPELLGAKGGSGTSTRYPLKIPPVVSPAGYSLNAVEAKSDLGGGMISNVWDYNGFFPGPTFKANRGTTATIDLVNGLQEPTITHWHGMIVDFTNDGHPLNAIGPGSTYHYSFPINQRAALNWYHPHPHMLTGKQVFLGLAGAFIVNDAEETALALPSGKYEVPFIIRDVILNSANSIDYKPRSGGILGQVPLVNGTRSPYLDVERAVYRFRILGGANARIFGLSFGMPMTLIGNDGGLLATASGETRIDIAPGERVDVLVDFRGLSNGSKVLLRDLRANWDLLELRVNSATVVNPLYVVPTTLSTITPLSGPVTTRDFSFDGMSKINGKEYDINRIDFEVPLNQTERWVFRTNGNAPHPVHVHGASFQVLKRTGGRGRLFPWEQGWKDTVLLEDGETVEILIRFEAYRGLYVMHCHKLEHEDMGMMLNFKVV